MAVLLSANVSELSCLRLEESGGQTPKSVQLNFWLQKTCPPVSVLPVVAQRMKRNHLTLIKSLPKKKKVEITKVYALPRKPRISWVIFRVCNSPSTDCCHCGLRSLDGAIAQVSGSIDSTNRFVFEQWFFK